MSETSDELQIVINFTTDVVVHQAIVVVHTKDERGTLFQTVWRWDGAKREEKLGLWKYYSEQYIWWWKCMKEASFKKMYDSLIMK